MHSSRWRLRFAGVAVLAFPLILLFSPLLGQENSEAPLISSVPPPVDLQSFHPIDTTQKAGSKQADDSTLGQETEKGLTPRRVLLWLWNLADKRGDKAEAANDLGKAAVFAIALLAAFLTVVEVWQIPPPRRRLRRKEEEVGEASDQEASGSSASGGSDLGSAAAVPTYGATALLFHSNFARTVLGGLAGMALVSTFDGFWKSTGNEFAEEPLYLVLFVTFFLIFLVISALFRGFNEAMRSRVSLVRRAVPGANWLRRFWNWFLSLRVPSLVFLDTGFNVIQGRNQLQTASFEHDIVELHESIVTAVCRVRQRLDDVFLAALLDGNGNGWDGKPRSDTSVRVNISLMADDESSVFYVSREVGSLGKAFGRSIAWLSLHTGLPLWHRSGPDRPSHLKIGNLDGRYEGLPKKDIQVEDYLEKRNQSDYQAFVVIPLPWGHRGEAEGYRKAGIHVSFTHKEDMDHVWPKLKQLGDVDLAAKANPDLLGLEEKPEPTDPKLAATLQMAAETLTELFRFFNDMVFEEQIRPSLRPN